MSEHLPKAAGENIEQASEDRGPACSPCVSLPARRSPSESRPSPASGGETERGLMGGHPAGCEPEGLNPEITNPRSVIPGIENQKTPIQVPDAGTTCRPDWIRLVGPESMYDFAYSLLIECFGEPTGTSKGGQHFESGQVWHPGVVLSQGHDSRIIMVDFQGSRLAVEETSDMLDLVMEFYKRGFYATRIDLAIDWVDQDMDIYNNALASCEASELCKLRSFRLGSEYTKDQEAKGLLLYLGKRQSAVYIRIYDKGLETGAAEAGRWERFEVEFKDDRAQSVMMALLEEGDSWPDELWSRVTGAVDFRVNNGRSELNRRPRSKWWSDLISCVTPKPTKPVPKASSFNEYCQWFRRSVGPRLLQLADYLQVSPPQLFRQLVNDLEAAESETPATIEAMIIGQRNSLGL